ncbi:MAG: type IV pilus assembly protein PilM [Patescibacteria group bacterium]
MDNPFKKLAGLFKKGESSVIGVDIGPSSIKVVQLKKQNGKAVLETYGALALGPYAGIEVGRATRLPPQKLAEALLDLLREASVTTKNAGLSIPMSSSLVNVIQVPEVDQKQLAQMIPIEARKYIPISISEVSLDWWVIPKDETQEKDGKLDVLLVVIHNDALQQARDVIKLSALDTSFFEIEIFSTIRAVLEHEPDPAMIVDLGAGSTKLYIVDRGILRVSHIVTRGSQDFTIALSQSLGITIEEAEVMKREKGLLAGAENSELAGVMTSSINMIFSEANRVLLNYQKKFHKNVAKVVLTGGGAMLKGFAELAQKELQTSVVSADPFTKIQSPAFLEKVLKDAGPEFAVAVGLALRKLQEFD